MMMLENTFYQVKHLNNLRKFKMTENVLEKIINTKSEKILELKKSVSLETLEELIKKNPPQSKQINK